MVTASEISSFLSQVHAALKSHNYRILDKRQKYMSTLMQLGLIEQDVLNDLGNLTVNENWVKKTDNNPSFPGDVSAGSSSSSDPEPLSARFCCFTDENSAPVGESSPASS